MSKPPSTRPGHSPRPARDTRGEAVLRSALLRSLQLIVGLALLVFALLWWMNRTDVPEALVEDAQIPAPVQTPAAPIRQVPQLPFTDISAQAGIDFVHVNGALGQRLMPETMGSGGGFFDYDNDGDQDLLLIGARNWQPDPKQPTSSLRLYANDGQGRFEDVTRQAGLEMELYGMGLAAADLDGDGWTDLYITTLGTNLLLHNRQGHYVDITARAGVAGQADDWSTASSFFDYDNDGDLDLFVGNYVVWNPTIDLEIDFRLTGLGRAYGAPDHFPGTDNRLYRNDGDLRFSDVSDTAGIVVHDANGRALGKALAVAPVDYDEDGYMDLLVANDTVQNFLYHNLGNGRFEEIGAFEGIGYDRNGVATGAMGIDSAHFRNDRELGFIIGNFANEMSSLYVTADGQGPLADEAILEGFGPASRQALTFSVLFMDADLDGWLDLLQSNGHLEPEINHAQPSQQYAQSPQLFWQCPDCPTRFIEVSSTRDLQQPLVGRGAAYADIDSDGDLDVLITQNGGAAHLYRNDQQTGHHWLRVRLQGKPGNTDAIGARLELRSGGISRYRQVMPTRGYLSQVELPVTFGLGDNTQVDMLTVTWPDGQRQTINVDKVDRQIQVQQP